MIYDWVRNYQIKRLAYMMKDCRFVGGQDDCRSFEFFLSELSNKCGDFLSNVRDGNNHC